MDWRNLSNDGDAVPLFNSATSDLLKDEYYCSLWIRNETMEQYPDQKTCHYLPSVSGVDEALTRNILEMKGLGLIKEDTDEVELAKNCFFRLEGVPDEITGTVEVSVDPYTQIKKE